MSAKRKGSSTLPYNVVMVQVMNRQDKAHAAVMHDINVGVTTWQQGVVALRTAYARINRSARIALGHES